MYIVFPILFSGASEPDPGLRAQKWMQQSGRSDFMWSTKQGRCLSTGLWGRLKGLNISQHLSHSRLLYLLLLNHIYRYMLWLFIVLCVDSIKKERKQEQKLRLIENSQIKIKTSPLIVSLNMCDENHSHCTDIKSSRHKEKYNLYRESFS